MSVEKDYPQADEFLGYWFTQAQPLLKNGRGTFEVAARAAMCENPADTQKVRRQLKLLINDPRFAAWARRTHYINDAAEAHGWIVEIIGGLTLGLRLRSEHGTVPLDASFVLPTRESERRRGWSERRRGKHRKADE